jgi:P4 family phage/plasmid primase-like protien
MTIEVETNAVGGDHVEVVEVQGVDAETVQGVDMETANETLLMQYDAMGFIYFPVTFSPRYDESGKFTKGAKLPLGWSKTKESIAGANVAIVTGMRSGLTVIDYDNVESYAACCAACPGLKEHYTVRTKKGFHVYFRYHAGLSNTTDCFTVEGVDIRNDGGCIIAPPSSYMFAGETYSYEVVGGAVEVQPIPNDLLDMIANKGWKDKGWGGVSAEAARGDTLVTFDPNGDILAQAVMGLSKKRADDYTYWIRVGMILYNEGLGVDLWREFSKQSYKYRAGECERVWRGFRKGALTERSLWMMLKEDDPTRFKELWEKYARPEAAYALLEKGGQASLAEHYVNLKPAEYLYDGSSGWWYLSSGGLWVNSESVPPMLTIQVSRVLGEEADRQADIIRARLTKATDEADIAEHAADMAASLRLRKQLLMAGFIRGIIEFLASLYAEQTLILLESFRGEVTDIKGVASIMDTNSYLFVFKDCLYDFSMIDGVVVGRREIRPTDYVTITCGYAYPAEVPRYINEVEATLKTIWSRKGEYGDDGETYEYVMKILATSLCGKRWMEAFFLMTGSGRNGKGLLIELMMAVLGSYFYGAPVQLLTTRVQDGAAPNPAAFNMRGKRMVMASEPEVNERLQEGTVKLYTGGDPITVRPLYGDSITFKLQCLLALQCNFIPLFNGMSRGGLMRLRVIPFPFEFTANPASNREKLSNPDIKNRLCKSEEWRDAMWFVLLSRFESVRGKAVDNVETPSAVRDRTVEYTEENNAVGEWWLQNYEQVGEGSVSIRDAWTAFRVETNATITDRAFKNALIFNLINPVKVTRRGDPNRNNIGMVGWRRREQDNGE